MAERCQATTKSGKPCAARPMPGEPWCRAHHPDLEEERQAWSARGGRNRSNARRAAKELEGVSADTNEVTAVLTRAFRKLEAGEMERGVAVALATVGKAIVSIRESTEIEQRLAALEARAGIGQERRDG